MRKSGLAVALASVVATPAMGQEAGDGWVKFGETDNGGTYYAKSDSPKLLRPNVWRLWIKAFPVRADKARIKYRIEQWTIDCNEETLIAGGGVRYLTDGTNERILPELTPTPIVPESVVDTMKGIICATK